MITLQGETLEQLRTLMNRFDEEWVKDWKEQDGDQLHRDTYAIIDMVRDLVNPKIPVINLKVPLYDVADDGTIVPFNEARVQDTLKDLNSTFVVGDGHVFYVDSVTREPYESIK